MSMADDLPIRPVNPLPHRFHVAYDDYSGRPIPDFCVCGHYKNHPCHTLPEKGAA